MSRWRWGVAALALASCVADRGARLAAKDSTAGHQPPDTLVATGPNGLEIWFTLARPGRAAEGRPCVDRAIEVRHGSIRTPVPLLYTGQPPRIVNDSTARAILYTNCVAGDTYLVDLRSGRPTRERT